MSITSPNEKHLEQSFFGRLAKISTVFLKKAGESITNISQSSRRQIGAAMVGAAVLTNAAGCGDPQLEDQITQTTPDGGTQNPDGGINPDSGTINNQLPYSELVQAFQEVRQNCIFPLIIHDENGNEITEIQAQLALTQSDSHLMRIRESANNVTEFHFGIDLKSPLGTTVVAPCPGRFWKIDQEESGGNMVFLQHDFPEPIEYTARNIFTNQMETFTLKHFYTVSMHLDEIAPEWENAEPYTGNYPVDAGTILGTVGNTGSTPTFHDHIEVRAGTWCSAKWQFLNQDSSCSTGYAPHKHPGYLLKTDAEYNINLSLASSPTSTQKGIIEYEVPRTEAWFARAELRFINQNDDEEIIDALDVNTFEGYKPEDPTLIDIVDESRLHIDPIPFDQNSDVFRTKIGIPYSLVEKYPAGTQLKVVVFDIHGKIQTIEFTR